jgi:EAL domain-containing protein (putative c-di-GMP-specific phosphodiesterase class I)
VRASDGPLPAPAYPKRDLKLEQAIAAAEPSLLYQPQIDVRTGALIGAEALARWSGEPDAEAMFARAALGGLAERLSRFVQRQALHAAGAWSGALSGLRLSVNLIADDLQREGYDEWLLDEIGHAGFEAGRLTVEITESALLADCPRVVARLERLRLHGIRVALDDFGTGYASLSYLSRLPLDVIKIDRGLVANIVDGRRDGIVLRALVGLARELDVELLAEGVETAAQLALLSEWGFTTYQGFFSAEALSEAELARFAIASQMRAA